MKFAAVLALLGCVACGPTWGAEYEGDPTENAIAVYEELHGALSEKCTNHALNVDVEFAGIVYVHQECGSTDVLGCMDRYDARGGHVWLVQGAGPHLIAHETMHVILNCMQPVTYGDATHANAVWQDERIQG